MVKLEKNNLSKWWLVGLPGGNYESTHNEHHHHPPKKKTNTSPWKLLDPCEIRIFTYILFDLVDVGKYTIHGTNGFQTLNKQRQVCQEGIPPSNHHPPMPPAAHRASHEFADAHAGGHRLWRAWVASLKNQKSTMVSTRRVIYATKPKLHALFLRGNTSKIKFTI